MKTIYFTLVLLTWVAHCFAQPKEINEESGEKRARMAIAAGTNSVKVGTRLDLSLQITNMSASVLRISQQTQQIGMPVFVLQLIDKSGKKKALTPEPGPESLIRPPITLNPGEFRKWVVPIEIKQGIMPGNYALEASMSISLDGQKYFSILSNRLPLEIK